MKRIGLHRDTAEIDQPQDKLRYAKNIVLTEDMGSFVHEKGHTQMGQLGKIYGYTEIKNGLIIFNKIGNIYYVTLLYKNRIRILLRTKISNPGSGIEIIELNDPTLINNLRFEDTVQADTTTENEDIVVVWTDNVQPVKFHKFKLPEYDELVPVINKEPDGRYSFTIENGTISSIRIDDVVDSPGPIPNFEPKEGKDYIIHFRDTQNNYKRVRFNTNEY